MRTEKHTHTYKCTDTHTRTMCIAQLTICICDCIRHYSKKDGQYLCTQNDLRSRGVLGKNINCCFCLNLYFSFFVFHSTNLVCMFMNHAYMHSCVDGCWVIYCTLFRNSFVLFLFCFTVFLSSSSFSSSSL